MNVLALYDIHGNLDALEAVLADPRLSDAHAIVVGGDVVPGAFASECLSLLRGQELPIHWVRGNGEREVAEAAAGRRMLAAGWPDQRSIDGGLIDPVDPMVVTRLFEGIG